MSSETGEGVLVEKGQEEHEGLFGQSVFSRPLLSLLDLESVREGLVDVKRLGFLRRQYSAALEGPQVFDRLLVNGRELSRQWGDLLLFAWVVKTQLSLQNGGEKIDGRRASGLPGFAVPVAANRQWSFEVRQVEARRREGIQEDYPQRRAEVVGDSLDHHEVGEPVARLGQALVKFCVFFDDEVEKAALVFEDTAPYSLVTLLDIFEVVVFAVFFVYCSFLGMIEVPFFDSSRIASFVSWRRRYPSYCSLSA